MRLFHFFIVVVVNIVIVVFFLWLLIVLVNEVKLTLLYATIVVIDELSQSYGNDDISGHHFGHYFPFPIPPPSPRFSYIVLLSLKECSDQKTF